jgi:hypothetical protein
LQGSYIIQSRRLTQNLSEKYKKVSFDKRVYECYNVKFKYNIIVISEDTQQIIFRTQLFVNHYAPLHEQRDTPNFTLSNYFSILLSVSKQETTDQ